MLTSSRGNKENKETNKKAGEKISQRAGGFAISRVQKRVVSCDDITCAKV